MAEKKNKSIDLEAPEQKDTSIQDVLLELLQQNKGDEKAKEEDKNPFEELLNFVERIFALIDGKKDDKEDETIFKTISDDIKTIADILKSLTEIKEKKPDEKGKDEAKSLQPSEKPKETDPSKSVSGDKEAVKPATGQQDSGIKGLVDALSPKPIAAASVIQPGQMPGMNMLGGDKGGGPKGPEGAASSSGGIDIKALAPLLKLAGPEGAIAGQIIQALPADALGGGIPGKAEGGGTTAKAFWVGDRGGTGSESAEVVSNPTGAPLHVLNKEQLNAFTPKFAEGTLEDIPKFAGGTNIPTAQALRSVSSGGLDSNPDQLIGGVSEAIQSIPILGDVIGPVVNQFEKLGHILIDVTQGFNKLAVSVSSYSPEISTAMANIQVQTIQKDIQIANKEGPQLAQLYTESNEIWIDIQKMLVSLSEPLLEIVVPFVSGLQVIVEYMLPSVKNLADLLSLFTGGFMRLLQLDFASFEEFIDRKAMDIYNRIIYGMEPDDLDNLTTRLLETEVSASRMAAPFGVA